jgi:catechol 2,3-dioxygenase-like lactoylglutathione lyase family enzyme
MSAPDRNPRWVQITPFFGVSDVAISAAFYRDVLGFRVWSPGGGYAYAERERVGLRLLQLEAPAPFLPGSSHAYVDLADADGLFAEWEPALRALPAERWGPLKDQPYGQREFWVRDPDDNLLTFGEGIGRNAAQWDYRQ